MFELCPLPQRKSPRLKDYDYGESGAYFVTACTFQRQWIFGEIVNEQMCLSNIGQIADEMWYEIPRHFPFVELDAFVVMPNHLHGILVIGDTVGTTHASSVPNKKPKGPKPGSLGAIIGSYKSAVTRLVNHAEGLVAPLIWQSRYHDHIIRNQADLDRIRGYILTNPSRWEQDTFYHVNSS